MERVKTLPSHFYTNHLVSDAIDVGDENQSKELRVTCVWPQQTHFFSQQMAHIRFFNGSVNTPKYIFFKVLIVCGANQICCITFVHNDI